MRMNARLMFSASPKPTASATRSTGSVVDSMRPRAISARSRSTIRAGVVPVCARNARLNWRRLIPTASAKSYEGKRFGDVIAGVADGGGNTIVFRCQIDRGREL